VVIARLHHGGTSGVKRRQRYIRAIPNFDGLLTGGLHPLLGVDHLLVMLAIGVLAALAPDVRSAWRIPLAFVGGAAAGGAIALAGVALPAVELVIASSVVAFGVLVAGRRSSDGWWLLAVGVLFGIAHGHAHGTEIPADAAPAVYVGGFLGATAALHATGTLAGLGLRRLPTARVVAGVAMGAVGTALLVVH